MIEVFYSEEVVTSLEVVQMDGGEVVSLSPLYPSNPATMKDYEICLAYRNTSNTFEV